MNWFMIQIKNIMLQYLFLTIAMLDHSDAPLRNQYLWDSAGRVAWVKTPQ